MQISTKTLASLLLVTTVTVGNWRKKPRFERLLQRHDRKGELRAGVLGTSPQEFRSLHKTGSLEEVVRRHGFLNEQAFQKALLARIRAELRLRGWSARRIDSYVASRRQRVS